MTIRELPDLSHLYQTITAIESESECASLLEDLCSQNELRALNQRLEVSAMLLAGETFLTIQQKLGVSSAIVARMNRALQHSHGGLQQVLERVDIHPAEDKA